MITRLFCGNEEPHEGHGWSRISLDGQSFEMHDCYGLPEGYYDDIDKEDCAPPTTQVPPEGENPLELVDYSPGISMRILQRIQTVIPKRTA